MTPKQKAVDQYIRDKHTQDECAAYIEGWEDGYGGGGCDPCKNCETTGIVSKATLT